MLRSGLAVVLLAVVGCATATVSSSGDDVEVDAARIDAPPGTIDAPPGTIDARIVDAPPPPIDAPIVQTITLSQGATTITAANTVSCNATGLTAENSYYRAFRLSDFGVSTAFTANRIDVGIESASAGIGISQTIQVKLYTVAGTFPAGVMTQIAGQIATVNDTATGLVLPVTLSPTGLAPAGSTVVAEVFIPDGQAVGNSIFVGSNTAAETAPSYIRAPTCGSTAPATLASVGFPAVHIVLTVTGTY